MCVTCVWPVSSLWQVEFEEFGARPSWLRTVEVAAPWTDPPPFLSLPRELDNPNGERFFVFDLFHNWHLGGGKYFISSSIVHIVNHLGTAGNIDARFAALDAEFKAFFKREGLTPHQKNLTKELFGLQKGQQVCPSGTWSKGDQTTVISLFLEDYCKKHVVGKTIHVHIVMVFDPTLIPNDLAQIYIYIYIIYIYIKRRIAFWFHLTAPYHIMFKVRGSAELELRGDFLPLGFLAVKPDEEEEQVEDMSSLDAAAR